ncbi:MAG: von Willebrand factor type A domain-containing protein [Saprospiraceae bacterium]|nr:von Willebrand factor type A domain-containing protein [Saprospiraceae bacterium]
MKTLLSKILKITKDEISVKSNLSGIVLICLIFISTSAFSQSQTGTIKGKVSDYQTGQPIYSAIATISKKGMNIKSIKTNTEGIFIFNSVPVGSYSLKISKPEYSPEFKQNVSVKINDVTYIEFLLNSIKKPDENEKPKEETIVTKKVKKEKTLILQNVECDEISVNYDASSKMSYSYCSPTSAGNQGFTTGGYSREPAFVQHNTESYDAINENIFKEVKNNPLSTFSIDVDRASYSNVRRFLNQNQKPHKDVVRIEEMINYFDYDYPQPTNEDPFSISLETGQCPWNEQHDLVMIGLKGEDLNEEEIPASNLVFLIDVSGSMGSPNKLPLLKQAFKILVGNLRDKDRVAMVVYAGAAGVVLESTPGSEKAKITSALDRLQSGGSTAGGAGIKLAYEIAKKNFKKGGNNRVILATDGDFNVGASSNAEMVRLIESKRDDGIFLSILGFGMGNYKDSRMEQISNAGNGNYAYIDNILEAKKVFGKELWGTLYTIAKDVKIQVEFNPNVVKAYRLIGYENRILNKEDFNDDKKDAGDIGCGHTVTALYEIIRADSDEEISNVDELEYQKVKTTSSNNLMTVKLRYKKPDEDVSKLIVQRVKVSDIKKSNTSDNFNFAVSVAEFGMLLRDSEFKENSSFTQVLRIAKQSKGKDEYGYRSDFIKMVETAELLMN